MKNELALIDQVITHALCPNSLPDPVVLTDSQLRNEKCRVEQQWLQQEKYMRRYVKIQQFTLVRLAGHLQLAALRKGPEWRSVDLISIHPQFPLYTTVIEELELTLETYYTKYLDKTQKMPAICLQQFFSALQIAGSHIERSLKAYNINAEATTIILDPIKRVTNAREGDQRILVPHILLLRAFCAQLGEMSSLTLSQDEYEELLVNRICQTNFNSPGMLTACQILLSDWLNRRAFQPVHKRIELERLCNHFSKMKINKHCYYDRAARSLPNQISGWLEKQISLLKITDYPEYPSQPDIAFARNKRKIQTNTTGSMLGAFIYVAYEVNFFPPHESKKDVAESINDTFITKGKTPANGQSLKHLYNAATTPPLSAMVQLKKQLKNMVSVADKMISLLKAKNDSKSIV